MDPREGELTTNPDGHSGRYYRNAGRWMFIPERQPGPTPCQVMTNHLAEHVTEDMMKTPRLATLVQDGVTQTFAFDGELVRDSQVLRHLVTQHMENHRLTTYSVTFKAIMSDDDQRHANFTLAPETSDFDSMLSVQVVSYPSGDRHEVHGPALEPHKDDARMFTADGVLITDGLVIIDYDMVVGTVDFAKSNITNTYWDGWFRTSHGSLMNGERMSTVHPFTRKPITRTASDKTFTCAEHGNQCVTVAECAENEGYVWIYDDPAETR